MNSSTIQHILWDWNGTLLNDVDFCIETLNVLCNRRGLTEVSRRRYREIFTFPVIEYYKAVGFDTSPEVFEETAQEWVSLYMDGLYQRATLHAGALEVLDQFRGEGVGQSILSAHQRDILVEAAEQYEVASYFEAILGIQSFYAESKLDLGRAWMDGADLSPDAVFLVGDTLHDYDVACAMGIRCALVAQGHQSRARLEQSGAPVLDSITEVPMLLDNLPSYAS